MPPYLEMINDWAQLILTIGAVIALIKTASSTVQAPNKAQDQRIAALEAWRDKVEDKLIKTNTHFDNIDQGNRITQKALLAIMSHELDGNNVEELKKAKGELENYLIEK